MNFMFRMNLAQDNRNITVIAATRRTLNINKQESGTEYGLKKRQ